MFTVSYLDTSVERAVEIYVDNLMPALLEAVARPNAGDRTPFDEFMDTELESLAARNAATGLLYGQY